MARRFFVVGLMTTLLALALATTALAGTIAVNDTATSSQVTTKIGQPLQRQLGWPDGTCEADVTFTANFTGTLPGKLTLKGHAYFSCQGFVAGNPTYTMPLTNWTLETAQGTLSGTGPGLLGTSPTNPNFTLYALKGSKGLRGATGTLTLSRDAGGQIVLNGTLTQ
ncbi:MAG: hypothetical protein HYY04_12350 [Chloroflexi bacterium]|nr:hypothetical protein [Chloroflexota bacterium]